MKKIFLIFFISLILLSPGLILAACLPLVPAQCQIEPCTNLEVLRTAVKNISTCIQTVVAPALGTLFIIIGALVLLFSAGNPNLVSLGKKILFTAIIGLALTLGATALINFILTSIGATGIPPV